MSYTKVQALLNRGVSRPTLYRVIIPRMSPVSEDQLSLLVKNTSVPEVSVTTIQANGHDAQGVTRESPGHVVYGKPFSVTIIADSDYTVYKDMRRWFDTVVQGANPFEVLGGNILLGDAQRAGFYDTITANIELIKLEQGPGATYKSPFNVVFNRAYPVRVGELTMASDAFNQFMEFTVDFFYETYTFNAVEKLFPGDTI